MREITRNPFNFFDHIYCINLKRRTDRRRLTQTSFEHVGISDRIIWFDANDDKECGARGCAMSHIDILMKTAIGESDNCLVFEDDVEFYPDAIITLNAFCQNVRPLKYDILYLGYNTRSECDLRPTISPHVRPVIGIYTTHAICYSRTGAIKILRQMARLGLFSSIEKMSKQKYSDHVGYMPIDVFLRNQTETGLLTAYAIDPILCHQRDDISDVLGKPTSYGQWR